MYEVMGLLGAWNKSIRVLAYALWGTRHKL